MNNRELKLHLWQMDCRCHWCKRPTKLIRVDRIRDASVDPLMATIDHLHSRYSLQRYVKRKKGEITKVLSCYECNIRRADEETKSLSKEELNRRSKGFSLNPRGKPIFIKALDSIDEVIDKLKKHGRM